MIKIPLNRLKTWLTNLNNQWFVWISAISITVAVNLLVFNLTSIIHQYKQNNTQQQVATSKIVHTLDSINNQLMLSLDDVKNNAYINYEGFQEELVSVKLQLLVQNKKIEILSRHIIGYEDMIRNEFSELDKTLKQFMIVNNDSLTIKYFKK
jgi:uncharacterized protein YktB (UPF0637 family)